MKKETRNSRTFFLIFLATGLLMQPVAYFWAPDNPWSLVSGLLGVCSVILCSRGNILTFAFGFGQIITYTYLCWLERFYAGIAMNLFYFGSQIYGIYLWRQRMCNAQQATLPTRRLTVKASVCIVAAVVALSLLTGRLLDLYTDDTQPYLDALTTVPAIAAQILMVSAYREQWFFWMGIDLIYIALWARAGNVCMLMQYAFWTANCVYGYIIWTQQLEKKENEL